MSDCLPKIKINCGTKVHARCVPTSVDVPDFTEIPEGDSRCNLSANDLLADVYAVIGGIIPTITSEQEDCLGLGNDYKTSNIIEALVVKVCGSDDAGVITTPTDIKNLDVSGWGLSCAPTQDPCAVHVPYTLQQLLADLCDCCEEVPRTVVDDFAINEVGAYDNWDTAYKENVSYILPERFNVATVTNVYMFVSECTEVRDVNVKVDGNIILTLTTQVGVNKYSVVPNGWTLSTLDVVSIEVGDSTNKGLTMTFQTIKNI